MNKLKPAKALYRVSVLTTAEAEDAVCELVTSVLGIAAVTYFDLKNQTSLVSIFIEQDKFSPAGARREIVGGLKRIKNLGLNTGTGKIEIRKVRREDWAVSWKRHFKPIVFPSLLVKPSWSKKRPAANQAVVVLDPGLSFGTGQHPTTSFCLHQIAQCLKSGTAQSFLDIGTGSGILAIAAVKLGYRPVHAFDFDPESVRVAGENARINHVTGRLNLTRGDVTKLPMRAARKFDLVCANLISNLLIAERRRIVNQIEPAGRLVLAGILTTEFGEVERAFADEGMKLQSSRVENEWRSGAFCFV